MENFGLLQLLNALLPQAAPSNPPADEPSPPPTFPQPPAPTAEPQKNACLDFFETHDRKAKQRKK